MSVMGRIRNLLRTGRHAQELADELAFHVDMRTEENIERGMPPGEARRDAERAFGNRTLVAERARDFDVPRWLDQLSQDLRYSLRVLRSSRGATALLIVSLALGIGANTAMFTLLYGVLMRPLAVRDPGSLYSVTLGNFCSCGWVERDGVMSFPIWDELRRNQTVFSDMFAYSPTTLDISRGGDIRLISGAFATSRMWSVLGIHPALGRLIAPSDEKTGSTAAVAVLGETFWESEFGRDPNILNRTLVIGGRPVTVVGVAPRRFLGMYVGSRVDVFLPLEASAWLEAPVNPLADRRRWWLNAVGRLRPETTPQQAGQQVSAMSAAIMQRTMPPDWPKDQPAKEYLGQRFLSDRAGSGLSDVRGSLKRPLLILSSLIAALLLLACANIATLQLSRAIGRQREFAVRLAMGASRARLGFQVSLEAFLAASAGAAIGMFLAGPAARMLTALYSTEFSPLEVETRPDASIIAFSAGLAILTAVLFGLAATMRCMRTDTNETLKATRMTMGVQPLRQWLLGVQVSLAVVLTAGAMLFGATLRHLMTQDFGFRTGNMMMLVAETARAGIDASDRSRFYRNMLDRLGAVGGVESVAGSYVMLLNGSTWQNDIRVEDGSSTKAAHTYIHVVSPEFFKTYGTPVLQGRPLSFHDTIGTPQVALVNHTFLRTVLGGDSFSGKRIRAIVGSSWKLNAEIVGVVRDAKYANLRSPVPPTIYLAMAQDPSPPAGIAVGLRTAGPAPALMPGIRAAMAEISPKVAYLLRPFERTVAESVVNERATAAVSGVFGTLALLLAGVGVYGLATYSVLQRRAEIGIRMALGASAVAVVRLLFGQTGRVVCAGVIAGAVCAAGAARFANALLFEITAGSLWVYGAAGVLLCSVAAVAVIAPAARAARLDPAETLRAE